MRLIGNVLRVYSYVFETILCAGGLLLSMFSLANAHVDVHVSWLPWNSSEQIRWIAGLSILGIICVALAAFGIARFWLFFFGAVVMGVLTRGLFMNSQYAFSGRNDARNAVVLVLGALLAFLGANPGFRKRRSRA